MSLYLNDFVAIYNSIAQGKKAVLTKAGQWQDFINYKNNCLSSSKRDKDAAFWSSKISRGF